jgi:hypothetical protein
MFSVGSVARSYLEDNRRYPAVSYCSTSSRLSKFRTCMIICQNYEDNKQKLYKIMITKMLVILDKAKPDIQSIRGLNLAAVKHTTFLVARLPL